MLPILFSLHVTCNTKSRINVHAWSSVSNIGEVAKTLMDFLSINLQNPGNTGLHFACKNQRNAVLSKISPRNYQIRKERSATSLNTIKISWRSSWCGAILLKDNVILMQPSLLRSLKQQTVLLPLPVHYLNRQWSHGSMAKELSQVTDLMLNFHGLNEFGIMTVERSVSVRRSMVTHLGSILFVKYPGQESYSKQKKLITIVLFCSQHTECDYNVHSIVPDVKSC